jgi:hypothetical protein
MKFLIREMSFFSQPLLGLSAFLDEFHFFIFGNFPTALYCSLNNGKSKVWKQAWTTVRNLFSICWRKKSLELKEEKGVCSRAPINAQMFTFKRRFEEKGNGQYKSRIFLEN